MLSGVGSSSALSCTSGSVSGELRFDWITSAGLESTSTVSLSGANAGFLSASLSGTVTSGLFTGDSYTIAFATNPLTFAGCLRPSGVTQFMGDAVSVFSHL